MKEKNKTFKHFTSLNSYFRPEFYFLFFLLTNAILSYAPLAVEVKFWIFLLGLILPLGWAVFSTAPATPFEKPPWSQETFSNVPIFALGLLTALGIYLRIYHLTSFSLWPHIDEGKNAYFALEGAFQNQWQLFYGNSQIPSFFVWGLGIFFKIFGPSLASLWLYPALISVITFLLGYWVACYFFSSSFASIAGFILTFNFWSLSTSRTAVEGTLIPLWECGGFLLLALCLKSGQISSRKILLVLLGFWTGLGFYVHYHWIILALLFTGTLWFSLRGNRVPTFPVFLYFFLPMILIPVPLALEAWRVHMGSYLWRTIALQPETTVLDQCLVSSSYITSLFWGPVGKSTYFGPVWGGFFNPLISSLWDLGILELIRHRRNSFSVWIGVAFGLCLLPGLLSNFEEFFRVIPLLPLFALIAAVGCQKLLMSLPANRTLLFLALGLVISMSLDIYHLNGPYQKRWAFSSEVEKNYSKSIHLYQAYQEIEKIHQAQGNGLVFTRFTQGLPDETLELAASGFNAAMNPKLDFDKASWAAVVTNVNYAPFLSTRFPDGKVHWFSSKKNSNPDGSDMVWVMPLTPSRRETMKIWQAASNALTPMINRQINQRENPLYVAVASDLSAVYPLFQKDPFLESLYWEKAADIDFKKGAFIRDKSQNLGENHLPLNRIDLENVIQDLKNAIKFGYPASHLYEHLGTFYLLNNDTANARKAFHEAIHSPLDLTMAKSYLQSAY